MALNQVRILDDLTINQISAGEVVDRPVSVVRELVENALDAGATKITIHISNGGRSLIKISDNGSGMSKDNALLAIERHATSKLSKASDLNFINSLGFRGEALPSIASVSKMQIKTRVADDATGTLLIINGGKLQQVKDTSCNQGTSIEVAKLFFNTPARKNFLKSNRTEELKIKHWLQSIAIANPQIALQLYFDDVLSLNLPGNELILERTKKIFPESLITINHQVGDLTITGFLSAPSLSLADASGLMIIVNKRLVSDRLVLRAVKEAFGIALKIKEFPKGFLHLELPPALVDVNVHPQKSEVRFQNPQIVFQSIQEGIKQSVQSFATPNSWVSKNTTTNWQNAVYQEQANYSSAPNLTLNLQAKPTPVFQNNSLPEQILVTQYVPTNEVKHASNQPLMQEAEYPKFSSLKFIGQALGCYLICEYQEDLFIVDLHAAHERFNYNQVKNNFLKRNKDSQILLLPISVSLSFGQQANLLQQQENLAIFGFRFEAQGEQHILISEIPSILKGKDLITLIKELAVAEEELDSNPSWDNYTDYICARIACHASKRSGDQLSRAGVAALFDSLDNSEFAGACPHGRPTIIKLSNYEIEKSFGRI